MTLKSDAKFEDKLILGSKNDMKNLLNFNPIIQKVRTFNFEHLTSMSYFCPKYI